MLDWQKILAIAAELVQRPLAHKRGSIAVCHCCDRNGNAIGVWIRGFEFHFSLWFLLPTCRFGAFILTRRRCHIFYLYQFNWPLASRDVYLQKRNLCHRQAAYTTYLLAGDWGIYKRCRLGACNSDNISSNKARESATAVKAAA